MKRITLKPCPFCGGKGKLNEAPSNTGTVHLVRCRQCFACTVIKSTRDEAAAAWNRRPGE